MQVFLVRGGHYDRARTLHSIEGVYEQWDGLLTGGFSGKFCCARPEPTRIKPLSAHRRASSSSIKRRCRRRPKPKAQAAFVQELLVSSSGEHDDRNAGSTIKRASRFIPQTTAQRSAPEYPQCRRTPSKISTFLAHQEVEAMSARITDLADALELPEPPHPSNATTSRIFKAAIRLASMVPSSWKGARRERIPKFKIQYDQR